MDDDWKRLLEVQDGVVRVDQAARSLGARAVRWRLQTGRWQRLHPRVVITHDGPPSPGQLRWGAVLHVGPAAALSRETAAEVAGLQGFTVAGLHVTTAVGCRPAPAAGLAVHYSRRLDQDVHPARRPRCVRVERALVDIAAHTPHERRARAVLAAGVQQRLTRVPALRATVGRLGPLPRKRLLLETLGDIEGGSQSLPELAFVRAVRRAGLPTPDRQAAHQRADGRYYLDARWSRERVTVEIDGVGHLDARRWMEDQHRHNELVIDGERVLRIPSFTVRYETERMIDQLRRALERPS